MNEIVKLKTEHARYKKCLEEIRTNHNPYENTFQVADAALNPPPPVTLAELTAALKKLNASTGTSVLHSIRFFSDESGHVLAEKDEILHSFYSFREALDKLTNQ